MIRKLYIFAVLLAGFTGPALADIRIVVPAHDIARGDVIADSDLTFGAATGALMNGTVTTIDALKGMEARRMLRAGQAVSTSDVRHPVVVTRGQTITMTFQAPGVDLTAMGRARFDRVLVLRTGSNFCMPPPGHSAAESVVAPYVGGIPALEAAYRVGSPVVHALLADWPKYENTVPGR